MSNRDSSHSNFCCFKCRGRSAHIEEATLPLTGSRFFPLKPGRFLIVTCTLCGYTEFYDLSVRADSRETSTAGTPIPRPESS